MNTVQLYEVSQGEYKVWGVGNKRDTKEYFLELQSEHDDLHTVMVPYEIKTELLHSSVVCITKDGEIILSPIKMEGSFAIFHHPESGEPMPWFMRLHLRLRDGKWAIIEVDNRDPYL